MSDVETLKALTFEDDGPDTEEAAEVLYGESVENEQPKKTDGKESDTATVETQERGSEDGNDTERHSQQDFEAAATYRAERPRFDANYKTFIATNRS